MCINVCYIYGQNCIDVMVPQDLILCGPDDVDLEGSIIGDYIEFEWTGTNGFSDNQNLVTTDFVNSTTTFTLAAYNVGDVNLITNGDFESGNTGFSSAYDFNPNTNVNGLGQGDYNLDVVYPAAWSGASCPSINGSTMMVINAAVVPNVEIYCTVITVQPNTEYIFTTDILTLNNPPPILQFSVNGVLLGNTFVGGAQCAVTQFYEIWDSGVNTTANICILNQSTAAGGNDFAMDNVTFTEVCKEEEEFTVIVEDFEAEIDEPLEISCDNEFINLIASVTPELGQQYSWSTADGSIISDPSLSTIIVDNAGIYVVTVTGVNGCEEIASVQVLGDAEIPIFDITGNAELGCANSSIFLDANVNEPNFVYTWILPNGNESNDIPLEVSLPGTYSLTLFNPDNNCSFIDFIEVTAETWNPLVSTIVDGDIDCGNESVEVSFQINAPYDNLMVISPSGVEVDVTNLVVNVSQAGLYVYTFFYGNCTFTEVFEVTESVDFDVSITNSIDTLTCVQESLSLAVLISGEYTDINWYLNGVPTSSDSLITISNAGVYFVEVINDLGCIGIDSIEIFENVDVPTVVFDVASISCNNPIGGFLVTSSNADSLLWSGNGVESTNQNPVFNQGGDYTLILYSGNGCNDTLDAFLPVSLNFPEVNSEIHNIDCNSPGGAINLTSNLEADFNWTGPDSFISTDDSIIVNVAGEYILTLVTLEGCVLTDSFAVSIDTTGPNILVDLDSLTCSQLSVLPSVVSDISNNISWTLPDGSIINEDTPLLTQSGEYVITAQSENGCETNVNITLESNTEPTGFGVTYGILSCDVLSTFLVIDNSDLTYSLFDGTSDIEFNDSISITSAGFYMVTGTNQLGCDSTIVVEVELSGDLPDFNVEYDAMICTDTTTYIVVDNSDLTYSLFDGTIETAFTDSVLVSGSGEYVITGTNQFGCASTVIVNIEVTEILPVFSVDHEVLSCAISSTNLVPSNPELTYTLLEGTQEIAFLDSIEVAGADTYFITGTNEWGCSAQVIVEVIQEVEYPILLLEAEELNCQVVLSTVNNIGFLPTDVEYSWTGAGVSSTETSIEVAEEGWYYLEVINSLGCGSLDSIFVTGNFEVPDIQIIGDNIIECYEQSEVLSIATSSENFESLWLDANGIFYNENEIVASSEGQYIASIQNTVNGCRVFDTIMIQNIEGPSLGYELTDPNCPGEFGFLSEISIIGGQGPYSVFLDNQNVGVNSELENIEIDDFSIHQLEIVDDNGCANDTLFMIDPVMDLNLDLSLELSSGNNQIQATTSFDPNTIDEIIWSPNSSLSCTDCLFPIADPDETTDYTLTIITENGCIVESAVRVIVEIQEGVLLPNIFSPNGDNVNDFFMVYEQFESIRTVELFSIYDRWGNKVFELENFEPNIPELGWNGKLNGDFVSNGVYAYFVRVVYNSDEKESKSGTVTVIR